MIFKDKKVVILGRGVDTEDIIPWLEKQGANLTILDEKAGDKFENLERFDLIIRSPGVYRHRPEIVEAERVGVEVSSKTKIFFDVCPAPIIGVTGTKGKGTTATLIFEMLKAGGKKVFLGGNIGSGVFGILPELDKESWVILELSSFQLIDLHKSPHIAVVLMVTSEHLDWHKDSEEYINAKKLIVAFQKPEDFAVINKDYPNSKEIGKVATGKVIWVSQYDLEKLPNSEIGLRGEHNRENIAAAWQVAKLAGVSEVTIKEVVKKFKGLEHRLEEVKQINGVTYFNDSFSTTPETAIAAIKAFSEPEIIILGGSEKGSDFTELGKAVVDNRNVKTVILIGQMAERIKKSITEAANNHPTLKIIEGLRNMEEIVKTCYNLASPGDVVILSPACASFDMFQSYKDRGQQFKKAVLGLESINEQKK